MGKTITITVRLIRSLEYTNYKLMVLLNIDDDMKVADLKALVLEKVAKEGAFRPYRTKTLDTMKLYGKAHGYKPSNLVINLEDDDKLMLADDKTLAESGIEHESDISFFDGAEYNAYKEAPERKW